VSGSLAFLAPSVLATGSADYFVVAGNGSTTPMPDLTGSLASDVGLNSPEAVAVDPSGNIIFADTANSEIDVLAVSATNPGYVLPVGTAWQVGDDYVVAGGGSDTLSATDPEPGTSISLYLPSGIASDPSGNIVITDSGNSGVDVFAVTATNPGYVLPVGDTWVRGDLYLIAGDGTDSPSTSSPQVATSVNLSAPVATIVDSEGNVLIADNGDSEVDLLEESATNPGYILPIGDAWTPGELYVIAGSGTTSPTPTSGLSATAAKLAHPRGLGFDRMGNVLIADTGDNDVEVLATSDTNPGYELPIGATWNRGELYVIAGGGSTAPSATVPLAATSAALDQPRGVAADASGNIVIADTGHHEIDVLAMSSTNPGYVLSAGTWTEGVLYVVAGGGSGTPSWNGSTALSTSITGPSGLSTSLTGAIDVADASDNEVATLLLPPEAPSITGTTPGDGDVGLTWSAPQRDGGSPVSDYEVVVYTSGTSTPLETLDTSSTATSVSVSELTDGTSYEFAIEADNAIGTSLPSVLASATPAAPVSTTTTTTPSTTAPVGAPPAPVVVTTTTTSLVPPTTIPTPPPTTLPVGPAVQPVVRIVTATAELHGSSVTVPATCGSTTCAGSLELTTQQSVRFRSGDKLVKAIKTSVIARASYTLDAGSTADIVMELTSAGRRVVNERTGPFVALATLWTSSGTTSTHKMTIERARA
jgi:hypothetical protein